MRPNAIPAGLRRSRPACGRSTVTAQSARRPGERVQCSRAAREPGHRRALHWGGGCTACLRTARTTCWYRARRSPTTAMSSNEARPTRHDDGSDPEPDRRRTEARDALDRGSRGPSDDRDHAGSGTLGRLREVAAAGWDKWQDADYFGDRYADPYWAGFDGQLLALSATAAWRRSTLSMPGRASSRRNRCSPSTATTSGARSSVTTRDMVFDSEARRLAGVHYETDVLRTCGSNR